MQNINVLHLITHLGVGGAQDNTLITVRGLNRSRYTVDLAAGTYQTDWLAQGKAWSDHLYVVRTLRHSINPLQDFKSIHELVRYLRHGNYQIVHTHSSKAGVIGRIAARLAKVPVIVHTVHGFPWHPYMSRAVSRCYQLLERYLSRLSDALITVSELNRQELIKLKIAPAEKITTIYSGIDFTRFEGAVDRIKKCREVGLDPQRPIVGTVARLSEQKAPLDFVAAARLVGQTRPDVQFVMVGDGPLRLAVDAAIKDMPNITLLGARRDVSELLHIFDIFSLASLWEGLGRALTEALIVGCPVAVTEVDGVPEIVTNEQTGLLSPPKRPDLLAHNIVRLLSNGDFATQLGSQGRERVKRLFSSSSMVEHIDELYQKLWQSS